MARALQSGWLRLSADFYTDPRLMPVSPEAELLYVRGLAYAKRNRTNGEVPRAALPFVAVKLSDAEALAKELLSVEAWEATAEGYRVPPDRWQAWQVTTDQEDALRQGNRERQRAWRATQRDAAGRFASRPHDSVTDSVTGAVSNGPRDGVSHTSQTQTQTQTIKQHGADGVIHRLAGRLGMTVTEVSQRYAAEAERLLGRYPSAPLDAIVAALVGEPSNLRYYATEAPPDLSAPDEDF